MHGSLRGTIAPDAGRVPDRALKQGIAAFIFVTTWAAAILKPSILGLIEMLAGPVIAAILYLMPMYAVYKVPALRRYRRQLSNIFVIVAGVVTISAIFYGLF